MVWISSGRSKQRKAKRWADCLSDALKKKRSPLSKITSLSLYIPFFSGMYKGILSIILGLILIFDPDKSAPKLTYIMGMFWATSA